MIKDLLLISLCFALLLLAYKIQRNLKLPVINISKQSTAFNPNKSLFLYANCGLKRMIASTLWITSLIESDLEHYQANDLGSWLFQRFDLMTDLAPWSKDMYQFGGQYLSVIKDDHFGALTILQKGLKQFPDDLVLNFTIAYHYMHELGEPNKSIPYFKKIMHYPDAPLFLPSLVAKLYEKESRIELALKILKEQYKRTKSVALKKKYKEKIENLKKN